MARRPTKTEARKLARAVKRALAKDPEALRRHKRNCQPLCKRWDDGPCLSVARAIATVDGYRGEIMEVNNGRHAVYVLAGVAIDGHGEWVPKRLGRYSNAAFTLGYHRYVLRRKTACAWTWARRSSAPLVRAIRRELTRSAV